MGQHSNGHPIIVVYGETSKKRFPLILVIGREPNNDVNIINKVGLYDFEKSPYCGFWNTSYKIIGEINHFSIREYKHKCKAKKSSIICISNCMPKPILNEVKDKDRIRKKISQEEIREHIDSIFSKDLIKRVKLIILAGV